jgi:hypothetical protein
LYFFADFSGRSNGGPVMTNKQLADKVREALTAFGQLPAEERERLMIAARSINEHGEVLMDPPLYDLCTAAVGLAYALRGEPNPMDFKLKGQNGQPDRAGALDVLRSAFRPFGGQLGICGKTAEERIHSVGLMDGPAWRRRIIAKILKGQSLTENRGAPGEALNFLGQALFEYRDALPGNHALEREIENLWPTGRPVEDSSLDARVS